MKKITKNDIAAMCYNKKIAFFEEDLKLTARYLNTERLCRDYDNLPGYVMGLVNHWKHDEKERKRLTSHNK
jgi:hypothetical protein